MRLILLPGLLLAFACLQVHSQALIPDIYGYTLSHSDSLNGPTYQWIDIRTSGSRVAGLEDDLWVGPIEMGLHFPYYWYTHDKIWISDNGVIAFRPNPVIADINPTGFPLLPQADGREDLLAPFMTDLTFTGVNNPGEVYTWLDSANKRFIISYLEVPFYGNNALGYAGKNSFQLILDARDSSITFQYARQEGNIDPILQNRMHPFVVGIEDQTGSFGMTVWDSLPAERLAIRMDPPASPLVEVRDAKIFWLQNEANRAFFLPYTPPPNGPRPVISAFVGNIGSEAFSDPIDVQFNLSTELGFSYQVTDTLLPPYGRGARDTLQFALPFPLPFPTTYSLSLALNNANDINLQNDSQVVEMVVVDTFGGSTLLSYVTDMDVPQRADGIEGRTDTTGRSGIGLYYRPFGNPVEVEEVAFLFSPYPDSFGSISRGDAYRIEIYDGKSGERKPGRLLYTEVVGAEDVVFGRWVGVEPVPPILIDSGGFFVAWIPLSDSLALISESVSSSPPISRQSFEIQDGVWKDHRSNDTRDFWVRARVHTSRIMDLDLIQKQDAALRISPNPGPGLFHVEINLLAPSPLFVQVFDMQGRAIWQKHFLKTTSLHETLDLRKLPEGAYIVGIQSNTGNQSQWIYKRNPD